MIRNRNNWFKLFILISLILWRTIAVCESFFDAEKEKYKKDRDEKKSQWSDYKKEFSIEENITTTVYHFGFSEEDGTIHSYAYRSTNSFKSESLQYGVGVKPVCQIPEGFEFPKDIIKMMDEQRAIQNTLPKNERVYIGGKIQIHHLTNNGFNAYIFGQFADYESDDQAIIKNYDASIHR
jgi:hypothetical protein